MNRHTPRPERNATTRWCGLAGALALLGAGLLFLDTGGVLPLDDAWIHLAFAKHLAESGQWGLLAGQPSGGETSPGYPLLLTLAELGPFSLGAAWALALGTLSYTRCCRGSCGGWCPCAGAIGGARFGWVRAWRSAGPCFSTL